ncbi:hypothetical protein ABIF26_004451 [Bradyrhizobium elkanii]
MCSAMVITPESLRGTFRDDLGDNVHLSVRLIDGDKAPGLAFIVCGEFAGIIGNGRYDVDRVDLDFVRVHGSAFRVRLSSWEWPGCSEPAASLLCERC